MRLESQPFVLRLMLAEDDLARLKSHPTLASSEKSDEASFRSVYFDSDDWAIQAAGMALSVTETGSRHVQTVAVERGKGSSTLMPREYTAALEGSEPDPAAADAPVTGLSRKQAASIKPVFFSEISRSLFTLEAPDGTVEMAIDDGVLTAGDGTLPIREAILTLSGGPPIKLFHIARDLFEGGGARLATLSVAERGYALLRGETAPIVRACDVEIAGANRAEAFRRIGLECLRQIAANADGVAAGRGEAVHQLRVGVRRLRTVIGLFARPREETSGLLRKELKWIGGELGKSRDLDVFLSATLQPLQEQHPGDPGMRMALEDLERKRSRARQKARAAVSSARFGRLTLAAAEWIVGSPVAGAEDPAGREADGTVETLAAHELRRRWRKLRRRGKALRDMDAQGRHRLRILLKKLRYSVEFFASLPSGKRDRKRLSAAIAAMKQAQEAIGAVHDIDVRLAPGAKLIDGPDGVRRRSDPERAFAEGLIRGHLEERSQAAIADAVEAFDDLASVKPFWKHLESEKTADSGSPH